MRKKFSNPDGKTVFVWVELVEHHYNPGTQKVEITVYPVGGGSYSSFIYTEDPIEKIEAFSKEIAEEFLNSKQNSFGSAEISDVISRYLNPIFPQRD